MLECSVHIQDNLERGFGSVQSIFRIFALPQCVSARLALRQMNSQAKRCRIFPFFLECDRFAAVGRESTSLPKAAF